MQFSGIYILVREWGMARGILFNGNSMGQAKKTVEEANELLDACHGKGPSGEAVEGAARKAFIRDGVGDTMVTLVMVCELEGISMEECFLEAYNEIKGRRGQMGVDGIFYRVGQTMPNGEVVA